MHGLAGILIRPHRTYPLRERLNAMVDGDESRANLVLANVAVSVDDGARLASSDDSSTWAFVAGPLGTVDRVRHELELAGRRFTTSDASEVALRGYSEWGAEGLADRLEDDTAFCVWDGTAGVAHVWLGVRYEEPLYLIVRTLGMAFSTSLVSLARCGLCLPKLADEVLWQHLLFGQRLGDRTLLSGVRQLSPGSMVRWTAATGDVEILADGSTSVAKPPALDPGGELEVVDGTVTRDSLERWFEVLDEPVAPPACAGLVSEDGPGDANGSALLEDARLTRDRREMLLGRLGVALPVPRPGVSNTHGGRPQLAQVEFVWTMLALDRRPSLSSFEDALKRAESRGSQFRLRERDRTEALAQALGRLFETDARDMVENSSVVGDGMLAPEGIEATVFSHERLGIDMTPMLWTIASIDRWWRRVQADVVDAMPASGAASTVGPGRLPTVEIVIPVHEGLSLVRDCIRSIKAFTAMPFRAVIIDDASCAATHERLRALVTGDDRFELVRNETNLGFLLTCERGFASASADYVVLLNSDTVVTPGWLERMVACAESDPRIAIVNPLSNEAANLSVRLAPGLSLTSMSQQIAKLSRRSYPDVTTAVGMCIMFRRMAVELLGSFDRIFAPAYCEESDLCMRYTEAGLRAVVADDAFVYHKGSASYGSDGMSRHYVRNRREFDRRWSLAYERDVAAYSRNDPLQYMRDALLVGAMRHEDTDSRLVGLVESHLDRLDTREALAASGDGRLEAVARELANARVPSRGHGDFLEWAVGQRTRARIAVDERTVLHPTRAYIRRLPEPEVGRLRITFLVASLPVAGGVIAILNIARELMLAGHDVRIVTEAHEVAPELLNIWTQPLIYRDRDHLVDEFPESDIAIATFWVTAHEYLSEIRRRHGCATAYFVQDYEPLFYPEWESELQRDAAASYDLAEHLVFVSQWVADQVGPRKGTGVVVPTGVDLDVFYDRGIRSESPLRVISVGEPGFEKRRRGFAETAEAFSLIHDVRPDVEFVFFGSDDSVMPDLPFRYTNAGRLYDQNDVARLMSSAHVLVDASEWQGFGLPGLEAMACGAVPVMTGIGGLFEYARDGENCLLTESNDPRLIADAVVRLLDDRALRDRLSANGSVSAVPLSHRVIAARHLEHYSKWIDENRARRANVSANDD